MTFGPYGKPLVNNPPRATPQLWRGERPRLAPPRSLQHAITGRVVDYPVYVLDEANFERAEQAIALCLAHGLPLR